MTSNVVGGWTTGISLMPDVGAKPERAPAGLIATRAIETKDGWRGQILVDKEIVFETGDLVDSEDALELVNQRVVARVKKLFV